MVIASLSNQILRWYPKQSKTSFLISRSVSLQGVGKDTQPQVSIYDSPMSLSMLSRNTLLIVADGHCARRISLRLCMLLTSIPLLGKPLFAKRCCESESAFNSFPHKERTSGWVTNLIGWKKEMDESTQYSSKQVECLPFNTFVQYTSFTWMPIACAGAIATAPI